MQLGESSGSNSSSNEIWAKLVPANLNCSDVEIRSNEMVICSNRTSSSLEKHVWCKITRNSDQSFAVLQNKSNDMILVDESVVQSEEDAVISCGSEIVAGPRKDGYLSYRFKVMPLPESTSKLLKVNIDAEHAKCSICLNIWHDVVTAAPCLHNFCNGCLSEWLRRSQEKHASVLCPQCRAVVQFVGRNHFLHGIEEDILQADSSLRRPDDEINLLDSYASIKSNLIVQNGNRNRRKRQRSHSNEEIDEMELPCPQCGIQYNGFRCNQNAVHLQCHGCGGMMPSRPNNSVPQHCVGCDRTFCGAYWHSQGFVGSDSFSLCSPDTFKRISERSISRIPYLAHEKNLHEQDITDRCIRSMGKTLQNVVSDWVRKLDNREIDRSRMPLNHAETITAATYVCNVKANASHLDVFYYVWLKLSIEIKLTKAFAEEHQKASLIDDCYDKLVSFLLYWFRITLMHNRLPQDVANREDCWYGYSCRTQHHNEEHARKRNHVCRPTRGSHI